MKNALSKEEILCYPWFIERHKGEGSYWFSNVATVGFYLNEPTHQPTARTAEKNIFYLRTRKRKLNFKNWKKSSAKKNNYFLMERPFQKVCPHIMAGETSYTPEQEVYDPLWRIHRFALQSAPWALSRGHAASADALRTKPILRCYTMVAQYFFVRRNSKLAFSQLPFPSAWPPGKNNKVSLYFSLHISAQNTGVLGPPFKNYFFVFY